MKIAKLNIEGYIGELDEKSAFAAEKNFTLKHLKSFLSSLSPDVTDIHYKGNSGGGSVYDGWDIHDALKASGKNLTSIGEGIVGSIATVIFLAASAEKRKLIKGTKFFVHNPYWLPDESEPMRANELLALGKDLKGEQDKILNFYAKESKATAEELSPYLEKETDLTAENAVKMGFASEVLDEEDETVYHQYRLVAMIKPKQNDMSKQFQEETIKKLNVFQRMFNRITKGKFFDMQIQVTDSAGNSVELMIESDTEDLTGKPAMIVAPDGSQSPAPDGDYKDAEGKTIKVSGGNVTEVVAKEAEGNDDVEALKAEIAALKAEKETLEASVQAKETENATIKAEVEKIKPQFEALKNTIIGEGAEFDPAKQEFKMQRSQSVNPNSSFLDGLANELKKKK